MFKDDLSLAALSNFFGLRWVSLLLSALPNFLGLRWVNVISTSTSFVHLPLPTSTLRISKPFVVLFYAKRNQQHLYSTYKLFVDVSTYSVLYNHDGSYVLWRMTALETWKLVNKTPTWSLESSFIFQLYSWQILGLREWVWTIWIELCLSFCFCFRFLGC